MPFTPPPSQAQISVATVDGRSALRLRYAYPAEGVQVWMHRGVRLVEGDILTLTLRHDGPADTLLVLRDSSRQYFTRVLQAADRGNWQTLTLPVSPSNFTEHNAGANDGVIHFPVNRLFLRTVRPSRATGPMEGDLYVRPILVQTAQVRPEDTVGLTIDYSVPGGVALQGERATCSILLSNHLDHARDLRLVVQQTTDDRRTTQQVWPADLAALAHTRRVLAIPTEITEFRALKVSVTEGGKLVRILPGGVAVVHRLPNYGKDDPDSFFGIHTAQCNYAAAERLGGKIDRLFVNRENELPFLKLVAREAEKHHQRLVVCVTETILPGTWRRGDGKGKAIQDYIRVEEPRYRARIREVLTALKGHMAAIEVCNEPDGEFWHGSALSLADASRAYSALVRATREEVQGLAPGLPIVALDTAGRDFVGADTTGWATPGSPGGLTFARSVFPQAASGIDIYGLHPYSHARRITPGQPGQTPEDYDARGKLVHAVELMKQYKGRARLWPTEWGWMTEFGTTHPFDSCERRHAAITAQTLVTGKSIPEIEKVVAFILLQDMPFLDKGDYGLLRSNGDYPGIYTYQPPDVPRVVPGMYAGPSAAAYATTAYMLHNARPVHAVPVRHEITAWRFDRPDGRSVLVLWHTRSQVRVRVAASVAASVEAVSLYGRHVGSGSKLEAVFSDEPLFLTVAASDAMALERALAKADYAPADPLRIQRLTYAGAGEALAVVANQSSQPFEVSFDLGGGSVRRRVQPGVQRLPLPLPVPAAEGRAYTVRMSSKAGNSEATLPGDWVPVGYVANPSADGNLGSIAGLRGIRLDGWAYLMPPDASWTGPDDLSADVWLGWNEKALYFAARVTDNVHCARKDSVTDFHQSDSVQLVLDTDGSSTYSFGRNTRALGFVLGPNGPRAYQTHPQSKELPRGLLAATRTGDRTVYEAVVPWDVLGVPAPTAGQAMPIDFIVNDNDGDARKFWMGLTPGIGEGAAPANYRSFMFQAPVR